MRRPTLLQLKTSSLITSDFACARVARAKARREVPESRPKLHMANDWGCWAYQHFMQPSSEGSMGRAMDPSEWLVDETCITKF